MSDAARQHSQAFELLSGEDFLLGASQLGYIDARADEAGEYAARRKTWSPHGQHGSILTIRPTKPEYRLELLAGVERRRVHGQEPLAVVRMNASDPAITDFLLD